MIKRWMSLLALLCLLLPGVAFAADRPNIVLIMADDMGYECVTANGGSDYQTPRLDALAKRGVRFTHGYSQPICTPTRVQIMTGLYNSRNYIRFGLLDPNAKTFANMLRDAGYATCIVGKWQLEGGFEGPKNFGFDEYALWQLTRTKAKRPNRFPNPGLEINGQEKDFKNGQYGPDIVSDYACGFIQRQAKANKPFLLYYPMILPHWPFEPTPDSDDWDPAYRQNDKTESGTKQSLNRRGKKHFVDMVAYTDKMVGKILKQLEDAGVRDNTLIIFTGDNGTDIFITSTFNGEPYPGGKGKYTLNATHVPLIVDWPDKTKGNAVCNDLVDFTDILPTLLDAANVPLPDGYTPDGRSFLPQLRGEAGNPRDWVYCWHNSSGKPNTGKEYAMTKQYKLYKDGRLFDFTKDFYEKSPIEPAQRTAEQKQIVQMLKDAIEQKTRR